jgi:hypothetical protein
MTLPSPLLMEHDIRSARRDGAGDAVLNNCIIASVYPVRWPCAKSTCSISAKRTSFTRYDRFGFRCEMVRGPSIPTDNGI